MYRVLVLDQEIVQLNEQHKRELENHEIDLLLLREELRHQKETEKARNGEI